MRNRNRNRNRASSKERTNNKAAKMDAAYCPLDSLFSKEISTLLKPPSPNQVQEYFQELLAERKLCGLKVKPDGEHGKGLLSEMDFQESDLVLKDPMLVGAQHFTNKFDCYMCSFCFRFIGSIELQIGRKLYHQELGISAAHKRGPSSSHGCASGSSNQTNSIPMYMIHPLMDGNLKLPCSEKFPLPSAVRCVGGCKEYYYCSISCAEADWNSSHSLLCVGYGSPSNREALFQFIKHAEETNDIFILAAKVISFTILRYRKLKAAYVEREGKNDDPNSRDRCIFPLLLEAWKPISMGYKKRWWDCIALPADVDSCDEADFRMQIRDLAFESLQILKKAMYDEECGPLFSLDIYVNIIAMFELNNLDLVVATPVEDYFLYIDDLPPSEKEEAEKMTKIYLDALGDDYAVSCQGSAFYPLQSCINHSCVPNAKAFKRDEDTDGQAVIIALRPIHKGEEVTISYIDEDLSYEERQESLADYGFTCKCPKCLEEQEHKAT